MDILLIIIFSIIGAIVFSVLACVPGLHVYNVLALMIIGVHFLGTYNIVLMPEIIVPLLVGAIVGFSMLNTVPSILLAAPDESAVFTVLPGQKFLMNGRGYEGVVITAIGGLAGLFLIVLIVAPIAVKVLPVAYIVFRAHMHWILWCVICFMLMSEWPKGGTFGPAGWLKFFDACKSTGAGLLTFLLSGLMGFILIYRSPVSVEMAFQNLMPAFVGLFTIPWLVLNIVSRVEIPKQVRSAPVLSSRHLLHGVLAGSFGGSFAAFFPVVTGGVGGLLAGHAAAVRNDKTFLVSQGASKLIYYVGGLFLFFVPGLNITRGGGAALLGGIFLPRTNYDYLMALASIAIAGSVSFFMVGPLAKGVISIMGRYGYRRISSLSLVIILLIVVSTMGIAGLLVMLVGTGIGLIPVIFGSRRMNCLGVILLPMACNMSGIGGKVAGWLGLL